MRGVLIKGPGVGLGTLPGLQRVRHGWQCKAEGQETLTGREPTSTWAWAAPPYAYACDCVLAYADKRLTIFNSYTHIIIIIIIDG